MKVALYAGCFIVSKCEFSPSHLIEQFLQALCSSSLYVFQRIRTKKKIQLQGQNSCDSIVVHGICMLQGVKQEDRYPHTLISSANQRENGVNYVVKVLVDRLGPTLCDPMDYSLPGSSVHGILQAGILQWVTMPFSSNVIRISSWKGWLGRTLTLNPSKFC